MTALAGLGAYLDLWQVAGLRQSLRRHLGVKGEQGWTDEQMVTSLVLLNLAGVSVWRTPDQVGGRLCACWRRTRAWAGC